MDTKQLAADLKTTQDALRNIVTILAAVKGSDDNLFYEIGRAMGTAKHALIMSNAADVPSFKVGR
jgi:spore maturation protein SpmB